MQDYRGSVILKKISTIFGILGALIGIVSSLMLIPNSMLSMGFADWTLLSYAHTKPSLLYLLIIFQFFMCLFIVTTVVKYNKFTSAGIIACSIFFIFIGSPLSIYILLALILSLLFLRLTNPNTK